MSDDTELGQIRRRPPDFGLFEVPKARTTDPETSHIAAKKVRKSSAKMRLLLAHAAHPHGLTDREAALAAGLSLASEYATRCSELMRHGWIRPTSDTRPDPETGMQRIVRVITPAGEAVALDLSPK
jgi:hypothetical protein